MTPSAFKGKDRVMIVNSVAKLEFSKSKCLDFHWVSNQLICLLNFNNGVVGGHIVEGWQVIWLYFDVVDHILRHFLSINDLSVEFASIGRNNTIKVHIVFSQCSCLIKATEFDDSSHNNFILRNTEDFLFIKPFQSVYDSKGHTDG